MTSFDQSARKMQPTELKKSSIKSELSDAWRSLRGRAMHNPMVNRCKRPKPHSKMIRNLRLYRQCILETPSIECFRLGLPLLPRNIIQSLEWSPLLTYSHIFCTRVIPYEFKHIPKHSQVFQMLQTNSPVFRLSVLHVGFRRIQKHSSMIRHNRWTQQRPKLGNMLLKLVALRRRLFLVA